jgi:L-malate glycosyltransferase
MSPRTGAEGPIGIVFVIGSLMTGGAEGQLALLAAGLDRQRFRPAVICLESGGPHEDTLKAAGIPYEVIGYEGFRIFRYPLRTLRQLFRVVGLMRRYRPRIVHAQLFWAYVIGADAARLAGVPFVIASRLGLGHFRASLPRSWVALERGATRRTDLVIANSLAVAEDASKGEAIPANKLAVVYNGIDTHSFRPRSETETWETRASLGVGASAQVVTVVANLIHYKGHRYLLEAWPTVLDRFPDAVLALVGEGPLRPVLQEQAARLGVGHSVRLLGTRLDVPDILAASDLVVHPSLEEGFSNAVLEAMAAGKGVIATDVGGNREAVVHDETGLLVPPADAPALAGAMITLLENPERRQRLGRAGRARVERRFDVGSMVRAYADVYEALVAGGVEAAREASGRSRAAER